MKRILIAAVVLLSFSSGLTLLQAADVPFDFEVLQFKAKTLAARPYEVRKSKVPKSLENLTYDQYRDIRFDPAQAWWKREGLPFQLEFFHPGSIHRETIQISEIEDKGVVKPIEFSTKLFTYERLKDLGRIPGDIGYTGLRVHYPLNGQQYFDELLVFQGASYFRALGQGMRYGLSARGLALNCGDPGGEEFPIYTDFWVQKPAPDAKELVIYAILDSISVAGAYRFVITPGVSTVMQVKVAIYRRENAKIKTFGIAPLTSMFWFGENSNSRTAHEDLRPEVHDSDGLMIERGNDEWLWRPLTNPTSIQTVAFLDDNPKGFGLIQRDRRFESYEDVEAAYHLRPSVWVEAVGSWGAGSVRLVELPTPNETQDNIVAFWVPDKLPPTGEPFEIEYKLHWFMEPNGGKHPPSGYTVSTRDGIAKAHQPELRRVWIDFDSPYLHSHPADSNIQAVVNVAPGAELVHQSLEKNPFNGTWRVALALKPDGSGHPVELRCFLKREPHILTETWSYLWTP